MRVVAGDLEAVAGEQRSLSVASFLAVRPITSQKRHMRVIIPFKN